MENVVELLSIDGNLFRPQFLPLMTLKWFVQLEQLNRTNEIYIFPGSILLCSKISAQTRTQIRYDLAQAPDTCTLSLSLSVIMLYLLFDLGVPTSSLTLVFGFCLFMGMFFDRFWLFFLSIRRWFVAPIGLQIFSYRFTPHILWIYYRM